MQKTGFLGLGAIVLSITQHSTLNTQHSTLNSHNGQLTKMIQTIPKQLPDFLATISPFDQLSEEILVKLSEKLEVEHYSMGRIILRREEMPERVSIVYEGKIRNLGYDPRTQAPVTLELLEPGDIFGWVGLVRGVASETAIASRRIYLSFLTY